MKLAWHPGNNCYMKSVGKSKNKAGTKLVQKFFYFSGMSEEEALGESIRLRKKWRQLVGLAQGVKLTTYQNAKRFLDLAYKGIDASLSMKDLQRSHLEGLKR